MKLPFVKERNFQTIISPLWDIELELSAYIGEMENRIAFLEEERKKIEKRIDDIKLEIEKAKREKEKANEAVPKLPAILSDSPFSDFKFKDTDF